MRIDPSIPLRDVEAAVEKVRNHLRRLPKQFEFSVGVRRRIYRVSVEKKA